MSSVRSGTFIDSGKNPPPTRKRVAPDGAIIVEKLPATVFRTYLDKAGNVRAFSLASGVNDRNPNAEYGQDVDRRCKEAGIIPYFECPMADPALEWVVPEELRTHPCMPQSYGARVGRFGTPCEHVTALEKLRKDANTKAAAEQEKRAMPTDQKMLEIQLEERDVRAAELKRANDLKERELAVREAEAQAALALKGNDKRTK